MQNGLSLLAKVHFYFDHPEGIPHLAQGANITLRQQNIIFPGRENITGRGENSFRCALWLLLFCGKIPPDVI